MSATTARAKDYACADHLQGIFTPGAIEKIAGVCAQTISERFPTADAIACTGLSGLLIAPTVATLLGSELMVVRKASETSHSCHDVEGYRRPCHYVLLDDLIDSGATAKYVFDTIAENRRGQHPLGIVLYRGTWAFGLTNEEYVEWNGRRVRAYYTPRIAAIDDADDPANGQLTAPHVVS